MYKNYRLWYSLIVGVGLLFNGCKTYKNIPYFTDLQQTGTESIPAVTYREATILVDDILVVSIQTLDGSSDATMEASNTDVSSAAAQALSTAGPVTKPGGYLVDKNGNIELPYIGVIHVAGLTRLEARDTIFKKISIYLKTPTVDVRFANFKVTVMGEVLRPATYVMPNEKVTIFDALGMAGDLTIYGKRENVVLIRDSLDRKNFIRLNLNSKDIVKSPYFFLRQNDVIYIQPSEAKAASLDIARTRTLLIVAPALSLLIVLVSRIK